MVRWLLVLAACSHAPAPVMPDVAGDAPASDAAPCATHVTYGRAWIHPANHAAQDDTAAGSVTWDGTCSDDGANSYAVLSNGWRPYFTGSSACELALDHSCGPGSCATRITYGAAWLPPPNHPAQFDDVPGRVFGACGGSVGELSNGWVPHYSGACAMSFRWSECGGLYENPVLPHDCADPGVVRDGDHYVMSCTSGNAGDAFPIYVSHDLATWTAAGHIFPAGAHPAWAQSDFWAPEIHRVGAQWIAYFSARGADGRLAIGAASAADPLGPWTPLAAPLVHDPNMGLIDASEFTAPDGTPYLLWKEDGNAQGAATPIHGQALAADGLSRAGTRATLITNDQSWEGPLVEGPFVYQHAGMFYLFYSGNFYASTSYALGVARASAPLGPYVKAPAPIVVTGGDWAGPGHCSVVDGHADTYLVYHAWRAGQVGAPNQRYPLVDQIVWQNGWPAVPTAPSSGTRPLP